MRRLVMMMTLAAGLAACGCSTGKAMFASGELDGWVEIGSTGAWTVEDGIVRCSGEKHGYAWLATREKYSDFVLTLDWRVPEGGNSGVFLRAPDYEGRTSMKGFEIQIRDDTIDDDLTDVSGSVFRRIPARGKYARGPGEWNHHEITMKGRRLRIELNGHLVSETDIDTVPAKDQDPPMSRVPDEGYIGLQNHGQPVEFRNVRIRRLENCTTGSKTGGR